MSNENIKTAQQIEVIKKDISAQVLSKIGAFTASGELRLPPNYSPENALKSAYLILIETKNKQGNYALDHCTKESIANALLKMVVWGLSPLKKQCDFVMYGDVLECIIEYTGNVVLAKRYSGLQDIKAHSIFEGDEFEFEVDTATGRKKIIKHKQTLETIGSKKIKGAYAVLTLSDGTMDVEIMNITQIKDAWNQGKMEGKSKAHINFPDQMANKTVINRATKLLIRASDDSVLYDSIESEASQVSIAKTEIETEIQNHAHSEEISFEVIEDPLAPEPELPPQPEPVPKAENKPDF